MTPIPSSRPQFTPGPWAVLTREEAHHIGPTDDRTIAADTAIVSRMDALGLANANLIAASPALYMAAQAAMIVIVTMGSHRRYTEDEKKALDLLVHAIRDANGGDDAG